MHIFAGIIFIILGLIALSSIIATTLLSTLFFGLLLFAGGIVGIFYGIFAIKSDKSLYILQGILASVIGGIILANPTLSIATITIFMAFYFIVSGIFRIIFAITERNNNWGWSIVSGIISLFLGIAVFYQWPFTGLVLIGLMVAVELLLLGFTLIFHSFTTKKAYTTSENKYYNSNIAGAKGGSSKKPHDDDDES